MKTSTTLHWEGEPIGRIVPVQGGDRIELIVDNPGLEKVIQHYFNPDEVLNIMDRVERVEPGPEEFDGEDWTIVGRRSTEDAAGVNWEYEVEGNLTASQKYDNEFPGYDHRKPRTWYAAKELRLLVKKTDYVNPYPQMPEIVQ